MENQAMCEDQAMSKLNRRRVKEDIGASFYAGQAYALAGWKRGEAKPASVITGELPKIRAKHLKVCPSR